jgi:transcriptional regulator with XRE-family HTH domain
MDHGKLFGKRIQKIRKSRKFSQHKLAGKVGIESKYLSLIETGRQQPAFSKIVAIADALDVPASALFLFEREEHDEKAIRRRLDALLSKGSSQQVELIYRLAKVLVEP